jgi:hypothetical protein
MFRPDPVLSASLYCERHLDAALLGVVRPFRDGLAAGGLDGWRMWTVRYSRGGEHLKLRLHGPEAEAAEVRRRLEAAVEAFLAGLEPAENDAPRVSRPGAPAIDEEDEAEVLRPDRTLLWTRYRRSHVSLGSRALMADDRYAALMTSALARATDLVLEAIRPGAAPEALVPQRQKALLKALLGGIGTVGLPVDRARAFLGYHRDWLVRFFSENAAREDEVRARFDEQLERSGPLLGQLRGIVAARWETPPAADLSGDTPEECWGVALRALTEHMEARRGEPEVNMDPFTDEPAFPQLFKAFHGLANQLGMTPTQEAFTHHLLLAAAGAPAPAEAVGAGA